MIQLERYFWLASVAWLGGCATGNAVAPVHGSQVRALPLAEVGASASKRTLDDGDGPRLFPPLDPSSSVFAGQERDGSRRIVAYGLRMLERPSGALELAREYLPAPRSVQSLELPTRLGGGYLFSVIASSTTLFFRAPTFTGRLSPFARLDFEVEQVIAGFDRLYAVSHRPDRVLALDAERGTAMGLGSLPPSPSYDRMAFVDGWFGAVQVPFRGTLLSFDAGASWRPLGLPVSTLEVQAAALHVVSPEGEFDLDDGGSLVRRDQLTKAPQVSENAVARALREGARPAPPANTERSGLSALKLAVLRGFRDPNGSFVVARGGSLLRVRAEDGQLLESDDHAYPGGSDCTALALGRGFGFVCSRERNTTLYSYRAPLSLQELKTFKGPRYVASSGNGALVVRGSCDGDSLPGAYCVSNNGRDFREIHVRGDLGAERVSALSDGRVAVIVPPRLGASGFLSLIDRSGQERRTPLKLPSSTPAAHLLAHGLWLDGFVERAGELEGWVVGTEPFAGVRVGLDGVVSSARPEGSIDRALISGTRALLVARTGRARESINGGFDWSDVELPSEFDAGRELRDDAKVQGCSELGCSFAGFVRVGWGSGRSVQHLAIASLPSDTIVPQPRGSRWVVDCQPANDSSPLPAPAPRANSSSHEDAETVPWAPFAELPAPPLASSETGFDLFSTESDPAPVHAYVWGERASDWGRTGHALLRTLDRFQVHRAVVQSAITRSPWPDAASAAEAFGFDGSGNSSTVRAVLDAGQRAAAVLVSSRGLLDVLLFEEAKGVTRIPNAGRLGFNFGMMSSVAKLRDAWYVAAFNENHALVLSKITGTRVERIAEYADPARDITSASLVRGTKSDELAVWAITGSGWYLFPIDPRTFQITSPLYKSPVELAKMPPACAADADGFLLVGSPSLEPRLRAAPASDELFSVQHVEGQFVWSALGLCTRALAADNDANVAHKSARVSMMLGQARATVPLTVVERRPLGRRSAYLCTP